MGIGYYLLVQKGAWPDSVRLLLMTGFLGAFTTFSAFSIEIVTLATRGQITLALWYAAASLITCVLAAGVGWWAAQKFF
jgi:CrcB protein